MKARYELDTIYPIGDGVETYRIFDNHIGKYIGEHILGEDTAWDMVEELNEEYEASL